MEDNKNKKKNKKKKNKQTKTPGDVIHGVGESIDTDQNRVSQENHENKVLATADVHTDEPKTDVDLDSYSANGTDGSSLAEAEKLYWMDREAGLEERIREVRKENDIHIQKEARLEETIIQLQKDNDGHIQKEASLEETIARLQKENCAQVEKGASLEMKLLQLENEKDSWLQKEVGFEGEISKLIEETASLSLKGVSFEEKIKQMERERVSSVQKENSMEDTIARLNGENTRLQIQVMELEESRNSLLQENLRLTEIISRMQSQIQSLEKSIVSSCALPVALMDASGSEDVNSQREAASQLVEKLVAENEELVEKGVTAELSLAVGSVSEFGETTAASGDRIDSEKHIPITEERNGEDDANAKDIAHVADSMSELSEKTSLSGKRIKSPENVSGQNGEYIYTNGASVIQNSPPDTIDSEEIVQIPLDEKEIGDPRLPPPHHDEKIDVPLTDAPLIGAPFRFISFMARYVSGADLVNKR
ncbi:uncharacterized protein LOC131326176 isoform X2 [Rhododendron vialii]|uniref:uncharacterized protein LOC131326176 isoform X2 n=1 Tax=Rhododendron vialii TaxID=182163 RepID=UPI00265F8264|nr:uncharacterized protein LOC131326176 isoform X2 [Rhododendron vialii]